MSKKITFLGIETSCDETAAAVIRENEKGTADVLSNVVSSQIEEHKEFGGVVPELAARAHLENIEFIIDRALKDSKISLKEIDGVAATAGRGLIVWLTIGLNIGKSIAEWNKIEYLNINMMINNPEIMNYKMKYKGDDPKMGEPLFFKNKLCGIGGRITDDGKVYVLPITFIIKSIDNESNNLYFFETNNIKSISR